MNKKKSIVIILSIIIVLVLILIIGFLMFTSLGREIREYCIYKITTPKEKVTLEEQDSIAITYTYSWSDESFELEVTDKELIKIINDSISNKKLENFLGQIGLLVMGEYKVNLDNETSFEFDYEDDDGYVMMHTNGKRFLTKINPEILSKVVSVVDVKLSENVEMYKTDKITISHKDGILADIKEKTAIEYIINQCKNIYTKEINYEPNIVEPDYEMDFNNNVKLFIYNENQRGWILKDGILSEAYGLNVFDTIIENAFSNIAEKKEMFTTDKITITDPKKSIEITDKNIIEKITTNLIYSNLSTRSWLETYDITEEYDSGIKIKINDNEFLIPGIKTIGNRYVITADKKINLCFPLQRLDEYVNELLGNKIEKTTGPISIAI